MDYTKIDFSKLKKDGFTKEDILKYWEDHNYLNIKNLDVNKLCHIWASEEGIVLPSDFSVSQFNSHLFNKINSNKSVTGQILTTLGYDCIPTEELTSDKEYSIKRAYELLLQNGNKGFIRGRNNFVAGTGTFLVENIEDIKIAIEKLHTLKKEPVLPLFSPYFEAPIEYGIFMVGNDIHSVVVKKKNPKTGLHNLSQGADAFLLENQKELDVLKDFCKDIPLHFNTAFIRIDVLKTEYGLKVVELSVPNFKRFSIMNETHYLRGKNLFLAYYNKFYRG